MTCNVLMGTLNPTHTHSLCDRERGWDNCSPFRHRERREWDSTPARHWTLPWQRSQQRSTGRRRPVQRRDIWTASAGNDDRSIGERRYKQVLARTRCSMTSLAVAAAEQTALVRERSPLHVINTTHTCFTDKHQFFSLSRWRVYLTFIETSDVARIFFWFRRLKPEDLTWAIATEMQDIVAAGFGQCPARKPELLIYSYRRKRDYVFTSACLYICLFVC